MTKTHKTAKDIEEELAKQNAGDYGEEAIGGHMASQNADDDVDEPIKKTLGNDAIEDIEEGTYNFTNEIDNAEKRESGIVSDREAEENTKRFKKRFKKAA